MASATTPAAKIKVDQGTPCDAWEIVKNGDPNQMGGLN